MTGEWDEDGAWQENAPESAEGHLAWQLAQLPALWRQSSVVTPAGSMTLPGGLDHPALLALAQAERPGLDAALLIACSKGIEAGRALAIQDKTNREETA